MTQPDPTAAVEERVARHLAARDWLTTDDRWDSASATFRAGYLAEAREVIALVQPAASSAGVAPATDQTTLRDRIAHALEREDAINAGYDHGFASRYGVDSETDGFVDAVLSVLPASVDRADVLREAADVVAQVRDTTDVNVAEYQRYDFRQRVALGDAEGKLRRMARAAERDAAELRRVAAETRNTTETDGGAPFIPPVHYRRDDGVDCCVHTIPVGPDSCPACRELRDVEEPAAGPTVLDEVVAALQAKAQALSVEAEEEMRRDLEDQAQVWHEAAEMARSTGRKAQRRNTTPPAGGAPQPKEA